MTVVYGRFDVKQKEPDNNRQEGVYLLLIVQVLDSEIVPFNSFIASSLLNHLLSFSSIETTPVSFKQLCVFNTFELRKRDEVELEHRNFFSNKREQEKSC